MDDDNVAGSTAMARSDGPATLTMRVVKVLDSGKEENRDKETGVIDPGTS
jgi:hypothetical protein